MDDMVGLLQLRILGRDGAEAGLEVRPGGHDLARHLTPGTDVATPAICAAAVRHRGLDARTQVTQMIR